MARSSTGLFGSFSGRIAHLVIYQMNGKTVVRSRPSVKHKPASGKRKQYQDDFRYVMKFMQATSSYIKAGFENLAENSTAFRKAFSVNLKKYRELQRPLAIDWLQLSCGNRASAQNLQAVFSSESQIQISWGQAEEGKPYEVNDWVLAMIINENTLSTTNSYYLSRRSDFKLQMDAPLFESEDKLVCFLSFVSPLYTSKKNLNNVSNSQSTFVLR